MAEWGGWMMMRRLIEMRMSLECGVGIDEGMIVGGDDAETFNNDKYGLQ
jgi:hypothetical protein